MTARFYKLGDAGAPALYYSTNGGVVDAQRFDNFKRLLKACLVNGYGSLPAAGWTLINEAERSITLRNAAGRYVTLSSVYLFSGSSPLQDYYFRVYLHNTFTGLVNGVPQGEGVVSGVAPGSAAPHCWGMNYWGYYAATSKWVILADENTFFLATYCTSYSGPTASQIRDINMENGFEPQCLYVGEDAQGNFVAVGGTFWDGTSGSYPNSSYFGPTALTTLHNPHTGLLIDTGGAAGASVPSLYTPGVTTGTTAYLRDSFVMSPVEWACSNKVAGSLRGCFVDGPHQHSYAMTVLQALFGAPTSGNVTIDHWFAPVTMADGYTYMLIPAYRLGKKSFMTNNPLLW